MKAPAGSRPPGPAKPEADTPKAAKLAAGELDIPIEEISGPRLKEVRERQGIPLQEVAENTRINITYLQYIEAEKFSMLPAEVFLRGYLDQYARSIFLSPSKVVEGYIRLYRDWKREKEG